MSHNLWTPSPDGKRWKIFPHISRHPLAIDFESPEDAVIVGYLSESQYRELKPHHSMSDDSEREKAFANGLRSKMMKPTSKGRKKSDHDGTGANRSIGPCAAMGSLCDNPTMENNRHSCSTCGKSMHIVGGCCARYDLETDAQVCGRCEYPADEDDDDNEPEVVMVRGVASSQRGPSMSRDMLASESEEEALFEDGDDDDEEAFRTPLAALAKNALAKGVAPSAANRKKPPVPTAAVAANASSRTRSPNFTTVEDSFITRAWCSATEDSRKGSGQKQQDFNKTLYARFVSLADEYNGQAKKEFQINMKFRTHKAIVERFAKIKRATSHFAGVVSRNKIKSGETKELHMQRCIQVYELTHKSKFPWLECYEILEDLPKWNAQHEPGTQGDASKTSVPASGKRKNRSRSTGKRQKALSDKIDRMLEKHSASAPNGGGGSGDRLSAVGGTLNQMTSHMVEQLNFAHWTDDDKALYFTQDAQEKALQQKKRILMLQKELAELQSFRDPNLDNGGNDDDEDYEDV